MFDSGRDEEPGAGDGSGGARDLGDHDVAELAASHSEAAHDALRAAAETSATVLKTHEDRMFPGAIVASMSTPWGNHGNTLGGYHLVWPRDAAMAAFALLASNEVDSARAILAHMIAVQRPDGRWAQNYFPNGLPYWTGIQLDETAFPILLAAKLREGNHPDVHGVAAMVAEAVALIARDGPASEQDR